MTGEEGRLQVGKTTLSPSGGQESTREGQLGLNSGPSSSCPCDLGQVSGLSEQHFFVCKTAGLRRQGRERVRGREGRGGGGGGRGGEERERSQGGEEEGRGKGGGQTQRSRCKSLASMGFVPVSGTPTSAPIPPGPAANSLLLKEVFKALSWPAVLARNKVQPDTQALPSREGLRRSVTSRSQSLPLTPAWPLPCPAEWTW